MNCEEHERPINRRRYQRYEIDTQLHVTALGVEQRGAMRGRSLDISEVGIAGVFVTCVGCRYFRVLQLLSSAFQFASDARDGIWNCGSRVDDCRIGSLGLKFQRSQFLSPNSGNMWPFRRMSVRKMIPFRTRGIVTHFCCSECDWTLDLECPFLDSDHARRAEETHKAKHWYSAHDCSRFQKPAKKSEI